MQVDVSEAAAAVLGAYLLPRLGTYRSSLALAVGASDKGWLPSEDDARIGALARFIAADEPSPDDSFLLRVGLVVPGLLRGVQPPLLVLGESRGGLSRPRLEEAAAQVARLTEALTIGRMVRPGLSSSQEQATRELLELLPENREEFGGKEVDRYVRLSPPDVGSLAAIGLELLDSVNEAVRSIGSDLLERLACFRFQPLGHEVLSAVLGRELLWPPSIYRDAPEGIAGELLRLLKNSTGQVSLNQLLRALAWTRSATAQAAFTAWLANPPSWSSQLPVPPGDYLQTAGWSIDRERRRRDLTSATCFQLLPSDLEERGRVSCFANADRKCPACRTPLRLLFDFARVDLSQLGGAWVTAPMKVLTCLVCARYAPVFADYTDNAVSLHRPTTKEKKAKGEWLPGPLMRAVSSFPYPPFVSAAPFSVDDASTLGGAPMWLQDAEYPRCPRCLLEMLFLAQFDNGSLDEEGIYYAFFCGDCRISAVAYQQT